MNALKFHSFGVNDGLSNSNVTCFMQDHLGRMWFGSFDGINVYDGFKNTVYSNSLKSKKSLQGNRIYHMLELDSNEVVISTPAGLNIFYRDQDSFALFNTQKGDQPFEVLSKENDCLILIQKLDILRFNLQSKTFELLNTKLTRQFIEILKVYTYGSNHSEYLIKRMYEIVKNNAIDFNKFKEVIATNNINDLLLDSTNQNIYLASGLGFIRFHLPTSTYTKILPNSIKSLYRYGDQIFVGSKDSGLYVYSLTSNSFIAKYSMDDKIHQSISGNYIRTLFVDRQQNLWASALGSGVNYCKLIPEIAHTLLSKNNSPFSVKPEPYIQAMAVDSSNKLWVADLEGTILVLDDNYQLVKSFTMKSIDPVLNPFSIQQIYVSKKNVIHLLTSHGIYYSDNHTHFQKVRNSNSTSNESIMYFLQSINDTLSILSTKNGLFIYNEISKQIYEKDTLLKKAKIPRYIYKDKNGTIYFNQGGNTICMYQLNGKSLKLKQSISLNTNLTNAYEEKDTIWFGTSNGILALKKHTFNYKLIDVDDGLPNQYICSIHPDPNEPHAFWCSSRKGIFKYNVSSKQSFSLGLHDGLSTLEFHSNSALRKNGDLVFCGIDGITYINPIRITPDSKVNELVYFNFKLNHKYTDKSCLHNSTNQYIIPYKNNSISFRLMQVYFPATEFPIRYKLMGLEKEWNIDANPIEIRYPNLREGTYTFVAQYYNRNRGWVENTLFKLRVNPPWYRTWLAYTLYVLCSVLMIWLIIRTYLRIKLNEQREAIAKQQVLMNERNRISADLHDDIGATLSSMHLYSDMASEYWDTNPEQSRKMIHRIKSQSNELMMNMGDIIWSMKAGTDEQDSLYAKLLQLKIDLLNPVNIQLDLNIDLDIDLAMQQPNYRKNILLIIKESLNNIAKYSKASKASISMLKVNNAIHLSIIDNGIGFSKHTINQGNGLQNMVNRATFLGGTCDIISNEGEGCRIECKIPIANSGYIKL